MIEWTELTFMLRGGAIGLTLLVVILIARDHRHTSAGRIAILFMLAVIGHIFATTSVSYDWPTPGHWIAEIAGTSAPPLFWLLARAWFDDDRPGLLAWGIALAALLLMHFHYQMILRQTDWIALSGVIARVFSLALVASGIYIGWRGRADDLIEERRYLRVWGIIGIGSYILLVQFTEIGMGGGNLTPAIARAWLVAGIFLLTMGAAVAILTVNRADLFGPPQLPAEQAAAAGSEAIDETLARALESLMSHDRLYRDDDLTIAGLAQRLGTQEYRLRKLINRQLGHRNFATFLNGYRLDEVREALADLEQREVPILTIALDAGFGSLGPFNRAFRESEKMTPSAYRQSAIG